MISGEAGGAERPYPGTVAREWTFSRPYPYLVIAGEVGVSVITERSTF
jgi:hypothetical protein